MPAHLVTSISPNCHIPTSYDDQFAVASCRSKPEAYRPTADVVEELTVFEAETKEADRALNKTLQQLVI